MFLFRSGNLLFVPIMLLASLGVAVAMPSAAPSAPSAPEKMTSLLLDSGERSEQPWQLDDHWKYRGVKQTLAMAKDADGAYVTRVDYAFPPSAPADENGEVRLIRSLGMAGADGLSFQAQTSDPGIRLSARIADATGQWHEVDLKFAGVGKWIAFTVPFRADFFPLHWGGIRKELRGRMAMPMIHVMLLIRRKSSAAAPKGTLLLRDFSLLVKKENVTPEMRLGLDVVNEAPGGVAFAGEKTVLRAVVTNRDGGTHRGMLRVNTVADDGRTGGVVRAFELKRRGETATLVFPLDCTEPRFYTVKAVLEQNGRAISSCENALAVVRRPPDFRKKVPEAFFGIMDIQSPEACARIGSRNDRKMLRVLYGKNKLDRLTGLMRADQDLEEAEAWGMNVVMTLNINTGQMPSHVGWKEPRDLLRSPAVARYWQDSVAMIVQRYRGRIAAIELINEPDNQIWHSKDYPLPVAADIYAEMLRLGRAAAKKVAPELPVAGLDVSGRDFNALEGRPINEFPGDFTFTKAVLARAPGVIDICGAHPYSHNRFMGRGRRVELPEELDLRALLRHLGDILVANGCPRRIWSTEVGWAVLDRPQPLDGISRLYAAIVAQALTLGKTVPGVEKMFWFTAHRHAYFESQYYDLFRCNHFMPLKVPFNVIKCTEHIYPALAASSYSACAYMLYRTKFIRELARPDGVSAWLFEDTRNGDRIVAFWSRREGTFRLEADMPSAAEAVNGVGRTVARGSRVAMNFDRQPVYLRLHHDDVDAVARAFFAARMVSLDRLHIRKAFLYSPRELRVVLEKSGPEPVTAAFALAGNRMVKTLNAAGEHRLRLPLSVPVVPGRPATLELTADGTSLRAAVDTDLIPLPYVAAPVADGRLDETAHLHRLTLADRTVMFPPDAIWNGPGDLSMDAWFGWNEKGLYFAARVRDDRHCAERRDAAGFWKSDSIQFALDGEGWADTSFDDHVREVGVVGGGADGRVFLGLGREAMRETGIRPVVRRENGETVYELFLPWTELRLPAPVPGRIVPLNLIVNENDGSGRELWMGLTPGLGDTKAPANYRRFIFTGK